MEVDIAPDRGLLLRVHTALLEGTATPDHLPQEFDGTLGLHLQGIDRHHR